MRSVGHVAHLSSPAVEEQSKLKFGIFSGVALFVGLGATSYYASLRQCMRLQDTPRMHISRRRACRASSFGLSC